MANHTSLLGRNVLHHVLHATVFSTIIGWGTLWISDAFQGSAGSAFSLLSMAVCLLIRTIEDANMMIPI